MRFKFELPIEIMASRATTVNDDAIGNTSNFDSGYVTVGTAVFKSQQLDLAGAKRIFSK